MTHTKRRFRTSLTAAAFAVLLLTGTAAAAADEGSPATPHEAHSGHTGAQQKAPGSGATETAPNPGHVGDEHAHRAPTADDTEPDAGRDDAHKEGGPEQAEGHSGAEEATTGGHEAHGDESEAAPERPRAAVLGTFAAVNSGVLLTALLMRRRTHGEVKRRKAARAAALNEN